MGDFGREKNLYRKEKKTMETERALPVLPDNWVKEKLDEAGITISEKQINLIQTQLQNELTTTNMELEDFLSQNRDSELPDMIEDFINSEKQRLSKMLE